MWIQADPSGKTLISKVQLIQDGLFIRTSNILSANPFIKQQNLLHNRIQHINKDIRLKLGLIKTLKPIIILNKRLHNKRHIHVPALEGTRNLQHQPTRFNPKTNTRRLDKPIPTAKYLRTWRIIHLRKLFIFEYVESINTPGDRHHNEELLGKF